MVACSKAIPMWFGCKIKLIYKFRVKRYNNTRKYKYFTLQNVTYTLFTIGTSKEKINYRF